MSLVLVIGTAMAGLVGLRNTDSQAAYFLPVIVEVPVMQDNVERFMQYAEAHPEMSFRVDYEGFERDGWSARGLAQAGCFTVVPPNVLLPPELAPYVKGIRGPYSRPAEL